MSKKYFNVTKSTIIDNIYKDLNVNIKGNKTVPKKVIESVVTALFKDIHEAIKSKRRICVDGLFSFIPYIRKESTHISGLPQMHNKPPVTVPAHVDYKVSLSGNLKKFLKTQSKL